MSGSIKSFGSSDNSEKGAALVTVLMVSSLMLIACIGLLTAAAFNTKNVTNAIEEDQAYYAAESGLQATINVLRGNTDPNPLFNATTSSTENDISYLKAINLSTSNKSGDSSTAARLSRWLTYSSTYTDRVILGDTETTYNPSQGMAYSIEVSDPDNTQNTVTYTTSGTFVAYDTEGDKIVGVLSSGNKVVTYGTGADTTSIEYIPQSTSTLNVSSGISSGNLGYFKVTRTGNGSDIIDALRFQIAYSMTVPHSASRFIRGTIYQDNSVSISPKPAYIKFDSDLFLLEGSEITITSNDASLKQTLNRPTVSGGTANTDLTGTMTPCEPLRLLVKSTGYGPHGAKKNIEAIIQKNYLNDLSAPAALTLVGDTSGFMFKPGTSNNVYYSGEDKSSDASIPAIGVTTDANLVTVLTTSIKTPPDPPASNVFLELPDWLSSPTELDDTVQNLRLVAKSTGRYYASGVTPPDFGLQNGTGITFADGDVQLSGNGGGILVCTGKLTLHGDLDFRGLIIVTGSGGIDRSGGGNGNLEGNTVIAPYNPNNLTAGFLAPKYNISGGGTSDLTYNSNSVFNGLDAISNFVLGIAEK